VVWLNFTHLRVNQEELGGLGAQAMKAENITIVEHTFDPETTEYPLGQRWGGEVFKLAPEHLAALQAGKAIALDVMNEYLTFVVLEQPKND
jgi:hypothetical protein